MDMKKLSLSFKRKYLNLFKKRSFRGVTPIIATILILALVVSGVVIGFTQILPYIERSKVETDASSIQSTLIKIDNVIWDMIGDSAGSYIPDSVPSRKLQVTIPLGTLEPITTRNIVSYQSFLCNTAASCPTSYDGNEKTVNLGIFSHTFSSTYVLVPENTLLYLTGSDPYQRRDTVSYNTISSSTVDDQSATNISLYRIGFDHHVDLSYRPKILVSQTIENSQPVYNVNVFLIKITGSTTFIGTTNIFLKYTGATIDQTSFLGTQGQSFELLMSVDGTTNPTAYAPFSAAPGGFTTHYNVNVVTHTFSLSG